MKYLNDFITLAKTKSPKRLVVAAAADIVVLKAVRDAMEENIIIPILVGNKSEIENLSKQINLNLSKIEIIDAKEPFRACIIAVDIVNEGRADILMKGLVSTAHISKAVLNRESGLRIGKLMSHIAFVQSPYYHKIFAISDAALNISPSLEDKVEMINNAVNIFHILGNKCPKVAVIGPIEMVNPKLEPTVHAAKLTEMNEQNIIKGCKVFGPLAVDNAISKKAAKHKGITSEVAGDADLLLTHDLNSGNILYKTVNFLGGASSAAIIVGAKVPIVLTSRADSNKSKLLSIALAVILT